MMEEVSLPVHRKTKTVQSKGVNKTAAYHSRTIQTAPQAKRRRRKAKKSHDSIALTLHAAFSTITNDSNTRFLKENAQLEENRKQAETSTNMLEATQTRTS